MLTGFYTVASGMLTQQRSIEVLGDNLVNAQTPGYRASRLVSATFERELTLRIDEKGAAVIGSGTATRVVSEVPTRFDPESLEQTGRPFDFAIEGEGFFCIEPQEGQPALWTRNGSFVRDAEGFLTLEGNGRVLGERGAVELDSDQFTVGTDGVIYDERGRRVDQLMMRIPGEQTALTVTPGGLYRPGGGDEGQEGDIRVRQGWLERANVDLNQEYLQVMQAQRAFAACSSALQIVHSLNQKSASQIASL